MGRLEDIEAMMNQKGVQIPVVEKPVSPPLSELKLEKDGEPQPSSMDEALAPVKAVVNDPLAVGEAAVRGAERSFTEIFPGVLEHIEAAGNFPIIRGAELAAKAFVPDDMEPEFTRYKDIVAERYLLTETLNKRAPGWDKGVETGLNVISGVQLAKTLAKATAQQGGKAIGKAIQFYKTKRADMAAAKALRMAKNRFQFSKWEKPLLDSIVERPNEVLQMLENDSALIDDLAETLGDDFTRIKKALGTRVRSFREAFVADPTVKIDLSVPVEVGDDVKRMASVSQLVEEMKTMNMSSEGVQVLSGGQKSNFELLTKLLTPRKPNTGEAISGVQKITSIPPHDALLSLKAIDDMIDMNDLKKSTLSQDAVFQLLDLRKALKSQIRGGNNGWREADDLYSGFMDASARFVAKAEGDSKVSFINNLFGKNNSPQRNRLKTALDYKRYVDNRTGYGDAFFSRLADIKATERTQDIQFSLSDPVRDHVDRIVQYWTRLGEGAGIAVMAPVGSVLGPGLSIGQIGGAGTGIGVGKMLGGIAGRKVGMSMADPTRVLTQAIKAKELSKEAKQLATDMSYVYKQFGPDGVVAMMDIVKSIPAAKELAQFGASFGKGDSKINSPGDRKLTKEDMTIRVNYGGKK